MEVSTQVNGVIDKLFEKFGVMVDWSHENIVPYLEELSNRVVTYEIARSSVWIILGCLIVILSVIISKKLYKSLKDKNNDKKTQDDIGFWFTGWVIFGGFLNLIAIFGMTIANVNRIILALTIPEIIVLEMLQTYIQ